MDTMNEKSPYGHPDIPPQEPAHKEEPGREAASQATAQQAQQAQATAQRAQQAQQAQAAAQQQPQQVQQQPTWQQQQQQQQAQPQPTWQQQQTPRPQAAQPSWQQQHQAQQQQQAYPQQAQQQQQAYPQQAQQQPSWQQQQAYQQQTPRPQAAQPSWQQPTQPPQPTQPVVPSASLGSHAQHAAPGQTPRQGYSPIYQAVPSSSAAATATGARNEPGTAPAPAAAPLAGRAGSTGALKVQGPPPASHRPVASGGGAKTFLLAFCGAALAVVLGLSGFGIFNMVTGSQGTAPQAPSTTTVLGSSNPSIINAEDTDTGLAEAVARKALPSVVNIDVYTQSGSGFFGGGGSSGTLVETSLGSGVILSEDGYIITNYHVIEGADALEVTIGDETYKADVIGTDPSSDLAVIKVKDAKGLTPIDIGNSSELVIGQWVMAIGSPFGLEQSVATGIVSATSRSEIMQTTTGANAIYTNLIQTDAAINPGNSGGALVDANGRLIGINTLISSSSGSSSGVGFAIPSDYAVNIAQQIIDGKNPTHAQLGVSLSTVNSSTKQRYDLAVDAGAYVTQIYGGSGAEQAGVLKGDVITKIDGKAVKSATDLILGVRSKNPGDKVSLEIDRSGEVITLEVVLGSDGETQQSKRQSS